jgi:hypothetical protein
MDKLTSKRNSTTISTSNARNSQKVWCVMAGDWMKIELELPDKPEVHAIAGMLNLDSDSVVGKLIRVWQWFDKHTTDGNAYGVTLSLPDRITSVTGFGEAMMLVGWLEQNDKTLTMPKFDRHTSASAKTRALTNKRVEKSRNAVTVTKALPEKRREDNKYIPPIPTELLNDFLKVRKAKRAGELTETAFNAIVNEAKKANITVIQAIETCCLRGWVGFKADWITKNEQPKIQQDKFLRNML